VNAVSTVLDRLLGEVLTPADAVSGCDESEIAEIKADQRVRRLPAAYVDFLERVGHGAGEFLAGTDAFYPRILGLKEAAEELFAEGKVKISLEAEAFVIAMHQGYQVFWFPSVTEDDPKVIMYQEGDQGAAYEWPSFSAYLNDMIKEIER
jgi:SMI1 / KNR4 family (SUKH-1)